MTTILVVDGDALARRTTQYVLQSASYTVIPARDTYQANQHLMRLQCDLLITELSTPHYDGFALLRALRAVQYYHYLPVIVLTNSGQRRDQQQALELGANVCLSKPVRSDILLSTVRRTVQQRFTTLQSVADIALTAVPQPWDYDPVEVIA